MKSKREILLLMPIIIIAIMLIVVGIKNYTFQNYLNKYFFTDNLSVELIGHSWPVWFDKKYYIYNKNIDNVILLKKIITWKESAAIFEKGGEYPCLNFKITSPDNKIVFFSIKIHHTKRAVHITFSNKGNQIDYKKEIEELDVLKEFVCHFVRRHYEVESPKTTDLQTLNPKT
jgi:hypothetical protein